MPFQPSPNGEFMYYDDDGILEFSFNPLTGIITIHKDGEYLFRDDQQPKFYRAGDTVRFYVRGEK